MSATSAFPEFKPIELEDRDVFREILRAYEPDVSEFTFTNLFAWRGHYGFQWSLFKDWLLIVCTQGGQGHYAMQPIGPSPRQQVTLMLLEWLKEEKGAQELSIERADQRLVSEIDGASGISIQGARDHFDYVYRREDLVALSGNRYRSKRNHINQLLRSYNYTYETFTERHLQDCFDLQERWCLEKRCKDDMNLMGEWDAVCEILRHYKALEVQGGVLTIEGKVLAFTFGEMLNHQTMVVHIEKADAEIPGLYNVINQQFCENNWKDIPFVNREQDLGIPGLREAKLSYYPDHLVEKYRITLVED